MSIKNLISDNVWCLAKKGDFYIQQISVSITFKFLTKVVLHLSRCNTVEVVGPHWDQTVFVCMYVHL